MTEPLPFLNPCPFCKKQAGITWHVGHYSQPWIVECSQCFAQGPHAETEREAILAWNAGAKE